MSNYKILHDAMSVQKIYPSLVFTPFLCVAKTNLVTQHGCHKSSFTIYFTSLYVYIP